MPIIVECLTDNRNRTSANVRQLFKKGQLAASGAVSWDFARLGLVEAKGPAGADPDEAALECGADDLEPGEDGATSFYTQPSDADTVSKALTERGWSVEKVGLVWKAKNPVSLGEAERGEVEAFLGAMDEDDDVQNIFVGLAWLPPLREYTRFHHARPPTLTMQPKPVEPKPPAPRAVSVPATEVSPQITRATGATTSCATRVARTTT